MKFGDVMTTQPGAARPSGESVMPRIGPKSTASGSSASGTPDHTIPSDAPGLCPVCGSRALLPEGASSALVAVCDVLVVKALEKIGKWLTRDNRSGYHVLGGRPWYVAHTIWQPTDATVTKILKGAWDVVPALLDTHGCCGVTSLQVTQMLDSYVHDLTLTGTAHDFKQLSYRFESRLNLPVYPSHKHGVHHG